MFGFDDETKTEIEKCPGEKKCPLFQIAIEETENGFDACRECRLLPTKPAKEVSADIDEETDLIWRLAWLRSERKLNGQVDFEKISEIDYQCLVYHEMQIETAERATAVQTRFSFEVKGTGII